MGLRKKIADSELYNRSAEALFAACIRFAYRSSRWQRIGFEPMDVALGSGEPVIAVLWHQRLMMSPYLFDPARGPVCTLTSSARAGSMAGRVMERFGQDTLAMSSHKRHVALSRAVLGKIRAGTSIGIAADGPRGPARVASAVPITWARASRKRVFLLAYSARRVIEVPTWDRMWLPGFWTSGVLMCREWTAEVPRNPDAADTEALRLDLQAALDALTDEADRAVGRQPAARA